MIEELRSKLDLAIRQLDLSERIDEVRSGVLGRSGFISVALRSLVSLSVEEKRSLGSQINHLKVKFEEAFNRRKAKIEERRLQAQLESAAIDVTLDGHDVGSGSLHPIMLTQRKIELLFKSIGFTVVTGPEIETDFYNFQALNIPEKHPARDMADTFYIESAEGRVLRTHTSPIQVRYMQRNGPPIKLIAPGRVFRVDSDATHSPMFHQIEGLWIDRGISFADLKFVMQDFIQNFFNSSTLKLRFRPSFFPFTEPSAEVDVFDGKNWLEVGGCGMVHPEVFSNVNINSQVHSGFAFGIGIERFAMLYYGIKDLRPFFDNDLSFLRQFKA